MGVTDNVEQLFLDWVASEWALLFVASRNVLEHIVRCIKRHVRYLKVDIFLPLYRVLHLFPFEVTTDNCFC